MAKQTAFIRGLIEKYKQALKNEQGLSEQLHRAQKAYEENRETKRLCAALLRKEKIDPESIHLPSPASTAAAASKSLDGRGVSVARLAGTPAPADANGTMPTSGQVAAQSEALNATHAVYLIIRKHGNEGYRSTDLVTLSAQEGTPLTSRDIHKVLWTQIKKGRMERTSDGLFRLTPAGEAFQGFRKKAEVEGLFVN